MRFPIEHEISPLQVKKLDAGDISQYDGMTDAEVFACLLLSQWPYLMNIEIAKRIARQAETWFKPEAGD